MMDGCFRGTKVRKGSGGSSGPRAAAAVLLWYMSGTEVFWSGANPPRWLSGQLMGFLLSISMRTYNWSTSIRCLVLFLGVSG